MNDSQLPPVYQRSPLWGTLPRGMSDREAGAPGTSCSGNKRREKETMVGVGVGGRCRNVSEIQTTPSAGAPDPLVYPVSMRPPTHRREGASWGAASAKGS